MSKRICYWNVSWGNHSYMTRALVHSMRKNNILDDFISFSDIKIKGCKNKHLEPSVKNSLANYMFKFEYLKFLKHEPYDYFIFIDADSFFVREPEISPISFMQNNNPWHCFLESPVNSEKTKRPDWWGVKNQDLVNAYRKMGITAEEIRNMNAGFWICKKEFIDHAVGLGLACYDFFTKMGFRITEEIPMAYISNYIQTDNSLYFHEKYFNYWASDWTGQFKDIIPENREWVYTSYMTGENFTINPAIVHSMRSKQKLTSLGKILQSARV